jgi:2-dehydro-3-deoxygluconokinase
MVELAPAGDGLLRQSFAGDTFNTAWYLRRELPQEWAVDYLTAVGQDPLSDRLLAFMTEAGIGTTHVRRLAEATVGLYLISLTQGERSFTYWRGQSAARHLADDPAALDRALAGAALVYFSGITLAILPAALRAPFLERIAQARREGITVAFDPNMRPRLWPSLAVMRAQIALGAAVSDIVLPSFDEEAAQLGDPDPQTTLTRYVALGADRVIVKHGAHRVHAFDRGQVVTYEPMPVPPVDTTAAGDSFNAGVLAGLVQGLNLEPALAWGAALARHVIASPGALVP